jgi:hypothetical protein
VCAWVGRPLRWPAARYQSRDVMTRATRLGGFTLATFLKITDWYQILEIFFPRKKLCINFDEKTGWHLFWQFFQKHILSLRSERRGPDVMILKIFLPKNVAQILAFFAQTTASF